jgi:hypothetical protein
VTIVELVSLSSQCRFFWLQVTETPPHASFILESLWALVTEVLGLASGTTPGVPVMSPRSGFLRLCLWLMLRLRVFTLCY